MSKKIMIVDDEPDVVDAVRTMIEAEGYEVVVAYSGKECLRKLKEEKVDLILLDIRMPVMDGWEVLRKLKEKGITNTTKVSMITAVLQIGEDIFGLQDVVADYIRKPFTREGLISSVRKALGEKEKTKILGKLIKIKGKDRDIDLELTPEARIETAMKYDIKPGFIYLIKEEKAVQAFDIFKDFVQHDVPGLCITRMHLDKMREDFGLVKTPILWLSKTSGENNLSPTDLGMLRHTVVEYIDKSGGGIVLLDGLEYLITNNGFPLVLKYLDDINESVMMSKSGVIIPVDPRTLEEKELALLERNMKIIKAEEG
jgi:CheY-like chemotaxis protein